MLEARMRANSKYLILATFVAWAMFAHPVLAQDNTFRKAKLPYGISLDVPSHWAVLSMADIKNLHTSSQAMMDNAGMEKQSSRKETLLAMNATPNPTGAMIRVSVTIPPNFTQSDLAGTTPADLKEVGVEMLKMFRQIEASGGPKIKEMQAIRIERLNNYRALVTPYIRTGPNESTWQVTQYEIPVPSLLIHVTLSYRQSDAVIWRPILERVKQSVRF